MDVADFMVIGQNHTVQFIATYETFFFEIVIFFSEPIQCFDTNSRCSKTCGSCVCKNGFQGRQFNIRVKPSSNKGSELLTNICFVEEEKPCQPDLLKKMVTDTDSVLTGSGKLSELIQSREKELQVYEAGLSQSDKTQKVKDELDFLNGMVNYWKKLLDKKHGMLGKSDEHWSCTSGSCSNNICDSGTNPYLELIPMYDDEEETSNSTTKAGSSLPIKHMTLISYFLIILSGHVFAVLALHGCVY